YFFLVFFFSSRRRHTRSYGDWSSDVCSSDLCGCCTVIGRPAYDHGAASALAETAAELGTAEGQVVAQYIQEGRRRIDVECVGLRSEERRVGKECGCRWGREQGKERELARRRV